MSKQFDIINKPDDWEQHDAQYLSDKLQALSATSAIAQQRELEKSAKRFRPSPALLNAMNAAFAARVPLLLTGEPGTGKTQVAWYIKRFFQIPLFSYQVHSNSQASDMRYDFDAVAYLRDAYLANNTTSDKLPAPTNTDDPRSDPRYLKPGALWQAYQCKSECVLLIDEIDKAPRDFPNDLLQELDQNRFAHPFDPEPVKRQGSPPITIPKQQANALQLANYVTIWTPTVTSKAIDPLPKVLPPLSLFLGTGLGFFWLLNQALLRTRVAQPQAPQIREHGRSFLPALQYAPKYYLLSPSERREMAWGIGRYLSEQPQNRLDIQRSVRETARQGIPSIHFNHATREREVWIWQDRGSNNPDLALLAQEITQTLAAVNIQVQSGYFQGLPSQVNNSQGETIWSTQHQQPENLALVMVLCDYDNLQQTALLDAETQHHTMRLLSHWGNLCIVDCSQQVGQLQHQTQAYQLLCLLPRDIPAWLAQQGKEPTAADTIFPLDQLQRWAIACAIPDRPLMEAEIRALHSALDLNCSWHYHNLKRYARETGNGWDFAQQRLELIKDFAWQAQKLHSDCAKTLRFWLKRYQEIDSALSQRETKQRPWKHSKRQRLLQLESALLQLWQNPQLAATQLADLHQHPQLRNKVRNKLQHYACSDWPEPNNQAENWLRLPVHWQDLPATTRQQLLSAGFGGMTHKVSLGWDTTTWIVLAILGSLMLGTLYSSLDASLYQPPVAQRISTALNTPRPTQQQLVKNINADTLYLGTVNSPNGLLKTTIADDHSVEIHWQHTPDYPARSKIKNALNTELWLAGENSRPLRATATDWPTLSIAVIAASPQNKSVQRLAAVLLDQGSADQVIVGKNWRSHQATLAQQWRELPDTQWLYLLPESDEVPTDGQHIAGFTLKIDDMLKRLGKPGIHTANALQNVAIIQGSPRLIGYTAQPRILELPHNMKLVRIPSGSFQMRGNQYDDEKSLHPVTIGYDFYLSQTEITFEQYDAYLEARLKQKPSKRPEQRPDDRGWGRANRPVINVSWNDAQDYTQWLTTTNDDGLQCRLPSEAEWEYAARAGTETVYPWGDEASHEYANYGSDDCCDGLATGKDQWVNTAPVAQFPANPFGLHDMHGNVYEWVQDCWHDDYTAAPTDGSAWESECSSKSGLRVLRGGSWGDTPNSVRSAYRSYYDADYRFNSIGFRVLCSPPLER